MSQRTLSDAWRDYVAAKRQYDWAVPEAYEDGDIDYLHEIGAHPDIIAAAQDLAGIDDVYLAAGSDIRKWAPLHLFKHSLLIADFGDGDYAVLLDARDPNAPVLNIMHDAPVVEVIANGLIALFEGLTEGLKSPTLKSREESDWGNYFQTIIDETSVAVKRAKQDQAPLGLVHTSDEKFDYFDFTKAKVGAVVDLLHRGRYTRVEKPDQPGVLTLGTESPAVIRKNRRSEALWWIGIIAFIATIFYYFYAVKGYALWRSTGIAVIGTIFTGVAVASLLNGWFVLKEKFGKNPQPPSPRT